MYQNDPTKHSQCDSAFTSVKDGKIPWLRGGQVVVTVEHKHELVLRKEFQSVAARQPITFSHSDIQRQRWL